MGVLAAYTVVTTPPALSEKDFSLSLIPSSSVDTQTGEYSVKLDYSITPQTRGVRLLNSTVTLLKVTYYDDTSQKFMVSALSHMIYKTVEKETTYFGTGGTFGHFPKPVVAVEVRLSILIDDGSQRLLVWGVVTKVPF